MATLALFVALGGAGYAAIKLPRDSVTKKQIAEDAVRASELAPDSVDSSNVLNESLVGADISDGSVGSDDLSGNSVGPAALVDNSIGPEDIVNDSIGPGELADDQAPQSPTLEECSPGVAWATVPPGNLDPHYWMDKHQIVHLEGAVRCPVAMPGGASIFQMPAPYRPVQNLVRQAQLGNALSIAQIAVVNNPFTAGVIYDGGSAANTEEYISLDGITYRGEGPIP
jgi:hypothetical protein